MLVNGMQLEQNNSRKTTSDGARRHYGWIVLAMGTLVVFGSLGLVRFGYSVVLPSMQTGLHIDNMQAGVLATVNLAGYLLLSLLGGPWQHALVPAMSLPQALQ